MNEDDLQKLLRITEENNAMLKEILAYVRKIQDKDYLANDYSREIAFNVIGDIIADDLNPSSVKSRLDAEDVQMIDLHALNSEIEYVGNSIATFITESAFYEVLLFSSSHKVKPFRRWITKEILPSIRKTGKYEINGIVPKSFAEALRLAADQQEQIGAQQNLIGNESPAARGVEDVEWSALAGTVKRQYVRV